MDNLQPCINFLFQKSWLKAFGYCCNFVSFAAYPYVYGGLNRSIRADIRSVFRSTFRRASVTSSQSGVSHRRWSISSHVLDYLPVFASSRSGSRRASADSTTSNGASGAHRCTSDCPEACPEVASISSSVFRNFSSSKASRRRVSAPSRLQHSTMEHVDGKQEKKFY
ncbi:uncharacterized protein LOC129593448 [Paramacrobiotus metropolitanus]|uniref:uncharacterized protein LOC129593448 n=1 Tax=Paramacrobiotus metropolitanus TaxID=2943436 RepID=UPI002445A5E6|nr:uncharacterized protein LOC129593448 [Paramacrobiotus metropolitanus]